LAALGLAIQLGVDMVEFDIQRSADGALVLFHDQTVEPKSGS
jgi:glycerophosphoryl diester phosphodiesterase